MGKRLIALTFLCAGFAATAGAASAFPVSEPANEVIEWNRTLLSIVRSPGAQPPTIHSTRNFAILHIAIYDAVNAIDRTFRPYLVKLPSVSQQASEPAAADQAAHDVLVSLYPSFQESLDAQLQQDLAEIADGQPKTDGISVGQAVAVQILAIRSSDGSDVIPPQFVTPNTPGDYQLTPPNFAPADFIQWSGVTRFALLRGDQFLPAPPPPLTSGEYTSSFNQVKSLGFINSTTRTPDQTQIGKFWNGNIQDFWNEIAQTAASGHGLNLPQTARLFALLNISLADTAIAFFDAKYLYNFWRPVTAIRLAADDGNPDTEPDSTWLPLSTKTTPDPSYPGAHSAISAAGAEVLRSYFGPVFRFDVTSESLPGVQRQFRTFNAAAEEAGRSRIYAGQHFLFDHGSGRRLGREVAKWVDHSVLLSQ